MSLEPDRWCLPGDWPRHKFRSYGRIVKTPGGAEYRRLLNFLSKSASQGERVIFDSSPVPNFAQVPNIVNRRVRAADSAEHQDDFAHIRNTPIVTMSPVPGFSITFDEFIEKDESAVPVELLDFTPAKGDGSLMSPSGPIAPVPSSMDAPHLSHLEVLLNEWFNREADEPSIDEAVAVAQKDPNQKRRERALELLKQIRSQNEIAAMESERRQLLERLGAVSSFLELRPLAKTTSQQSPPEKPRRRKQVDHRHQGIPPALVFTTILLSSGSRREVFQNGASILKDAVGRVVTVKSHNEATINFTYDDKGKVKSFVRSDKDGKIYTTGVRDRHGVVVRDDHGSIRAQGDSMTVDSAGCVSIRKFDGQFWSLDMLRSIHIERRILEDLNGNWTSLTALLTCDGFRMVTRFQKLNEKKRESYRKYGDWLGGDETSKFRFYGRDGSMIQFDNDEDLQALRPSRIWPRGSRNIEPEWVGKRQGGTAWESVHSYISQYLSAL